MDLALSIITGIISGVISGCGVFWLLSLYVPGVEIVSATLTDRFRIQVRNAGRPIVYRYPVADAVDIVAELHIVNSIIDDDPSYSRPIPLIRNIPLIVRPRGTFVFVTRRSTEDLREYLNNTRDDWIASNRNVENIGVRFRLFSRDGFSNVGNTVVGTWRMASFSGSGVISS
jgi:hypothetical protein